MTFDDLITVIVPVYNVEYYLEKCIQSIICQTYDSLEIILVDDGSTDGSGNICDRWAKKDGRIKVFHQLNQGLSAARNTGLDHANGNYIGFVDSDDYLDIKMYECLYKKGQETDADLVICDCMQISGGNDSEIIDDLPILQDEVLYGEDKWKCLQALNRPNYWKYVTAWNKLYKKDLFDNLQFPVGKKNEDEYIIHYILDRCKIVAISSLKLYMYVQREGSIMSIQKQKTSYDGFYALKNRYGFFLEKNNKSMMQSALLVMYVLMKEYLKIKGNKQNLATEYGWLVKHLSHSDKMLCAKLIIRWMMAR